MNPVVVIATTGNLFKAGENMETTLFAVMGNIKNFFIRTIERGDFTITDGVITVKDTYLAGQYVRIVGSVLNDGVYKVEAYENKQITITSSTNEAFTGAICGLAVPQDFIELAGDIKRFITSERDDKHAGRVTSESFAGYSYTVGSTGQNGTPISWPEAFASRLNKYRKMFEERVI